MRILHIEKMLFSASGVTSVVRALSAVQRRGGNEVWEFSCKPSGSPGREPEYYDFAASRNPAAIVRLVHNSQAADRLAALLRDHPVDVAHGYFSNLLKKKPMIFLSTVLIIQD